MDMTPDQPPLPSSEKPVRSLARTGNHTLGATILRETDRMRIGMPARLLSVRNMEVTLLTETPLEVGEAVKLVLRNDVQRFAKKTRGIVKSVEDAEQDCAHNHIELLLLLTPHEVTMLRMGLYAESHEDPPRWV